MFHTKNNDFINRWLLFNFAPKLLIQFCLSCFFAFSLVLRKFILQSWEIMRKLVFTIALFIFISISGYSQESSFYDAPFGGGGGYTPFWFAPNMDALNLQAKSFGVPEFSTGGFYVSGGGGFIYLGVVKNLRIGGMGFGGTTSKTSSSGGINSEVDYSLSGGGLTVEYTIPFVRSVAVSIGAIIGRGSLEVQLYKNNGAHSWEGIWNNASGSTSSSYHAVLKNNYWIFTPTLNVDIPAYRMLSFRVGIGYQLNAGDKWTYDNGQDLLNVPSGINGKSFFIQTGIFIGLFSY